MKSVLVALAAAAAFAQEPLTEREKALLERLEKLEARLAALEAKSGGPVLAPQPNPPPAPEEPTVVPPGATVNVNLDGYYGYNFNRPYTLTNALRAYDVSHNSLSINQAGLIVERTANLDRGRRVGGRLDLMFGQATETLQGSPANEPRPFVVRHIFQAYGTVVAPVGKGLTVDFGKWASSLGIEGNYTKDQWNYSRSYWFNFLPFYHMGFRATYPVTGKFTASYWLTNGTNQTEDFNAFKSQAAILNLAPSRRFTANVQYFSGQEQRAVNGRAPRGRSHIVDSYFTWQATERWSFAGEADYVVSRVEPNSAPQRVTGGAGYARYRFGPRFNLAGRFAYLRDSGGLFSGTTQSLKDSTLTATFDLVDGFQMRWEVRRDWSNVAFFPTADPETLKREQTTALLGLIWWFGGKQGAW
jgi:hypothetical protein